MYSRNLDCSCLDLALYLGKCLGNGPVMKIEDLLALALKSIGLDLECFLRSRNFSLLLEGNYLETYRVFPNEGRGLLGVYAPGPGISMAVAGTKEDLGDLSKLTFGPVRVDFNEYAPGPGVSS